MALPFCFFRNGGEGGKRIYSASRLSGMRYKCWGDFFIIRRDVLERSACDGSRQDGLFCGFLFGCGGCRFGLVFFLEFFHASRRVDDFLLAGHERMAVGADFDLDVFFGGACFNHIAANARDGRRFVVRMNPCFH